MFSNRLAASRTRKGRSRPCFVPRMEALECRTLPSTYTVLNLADSGAGSLRAAILAAEAHAGPDLISFANGVKGTITLTSGELGITSDLTIEGPGADKLTLSGNDSSRVFNVFGGVDESTAITVNISGLTITHGRAERGGGVNNVNFSALTLRGVTLTGNMALSTPAVTSATGAGVRSIGIGNSLKVIDSLVAGNTADGTPNSVIALGGGITESEGKLTVLNSTIAENRTHGRSCEGAGVFSRSESVTIANCVISGNQAIGTVGFGFGGGVAFLSGSVAITNSTISDNLAAGGANNLCFGGGVLISDCTASLTNCTLSGNQAIASTRNEALGGAIGADFASVALSGCVITDNLARGGDGGPDGCAFGGGIFTDFSFVSISDSLLMGNRAVGGSAHAGTLDVSAGTGFGGGIANTLGSNLEINQCIVQRNHAIGGNNNVSAAPNQAEAGGADGGAIFNGLKARAVIRDSTIEHNQAVGGNGNRASGPTAFAGTGVGGGINNYYVGLGASEITVIGCTIRDNAAVGGNDNTACGGAPFAGAGLGGGFANYFGASGDIASSTISHNRATGGERNTSNGSVPAGLGADGAIFNALGHFHLDTGDILAPSVVTLTASTVDHNQALGGRDAAGNGTDGWGGAIANLFDADTTLIGSTLEQNLAIGGDGQAGADGGDGLGGGAFTDATSSFSLAASVVTDNHANGGDGKHDGRGIGGGVYNLGALLVDAATTVKKNHASTAYDDIFG